MNYLDRMAYDSGGYTVQEILSSFCNKILEIIDLVNKNEKTCEETQTIIENIRNEDVPDLVNDIIKEMQDNGYFDGLVNVTLIEQLRTELTTLLNDSITDITTRLNNFNTQLDTKTNDINKLNKNKMDKDTTNISVSQINKNLGKFDQSYMTDEFLQQIVGNTPISSTVANKSITNDKLADNVIPNFLHDVTTEMNYINNNTLTTGGLRNDGIVDPSVTVNSVTDYIAITPNTQIYRLNTNPVVVGFYTSEKTFIRRDTVSEITFTTPENVAYMRYSSSTENVISEVLSLFPVKYYTPFNTIANFRFSEKYKMNIPSIQRKGLDDHFLDLSLNKFLSSTDNINDYTKDGLFIGIDSINAPTSGSFIYENKGLKNGGEVRWVIQTAINLNNINERYIRRIDIYESENNSKWVSLNSNKLYNKNLVCFGDSITQGVGSTDEKTKSYPMIINRKYGMNVINKGIAGATMANYNDGYDNISVLSQIENTDFTNIDYAVIFIGTNDFGRGNTGRVIGNVDSVNTSEFTGALNIGIKNILEANPKIKILLVTPMWRQRLAPNDNKDSDINQFNGKYLKEYVTALIEVGKINHIPVKNLYDECLINKYNYSAYLADGLHPNDYGHEYLADVIYSSLNRLY